MKLFLIKIAIWGILFTGIGLALIHSGKFDFYGNELLDKKVAHVNKSSNYNTLLIGSSRVYRQLDPRKINEIAPNINAFNVAAPATFVTENLYATDRLDFQNISYFILEIESIKPIPSVNEHSAKIIYYHDEKETKFEFSNFVYEKEYLESVRPIKCYIRNLFHFSKFLYKKDNKNSKVIKEYLGFEALDTTKRYLAERYYEFHKDTLQLKKKTK